MADSDMQIWLFCEPEQVLTQEVAAGRTSAQSLRRVHGGGRLAGPGLPARRGGRWRSCLRRPRSEPATGKARLDEQVTGRVGSGVPTSMRPSRGMFSGLGWFLMRDLEGAEDAADGLVSADQDSMS
jgi:hypothetical protein